MAPPVAVAVVSWNTRDALRACLDSLRSDVEAGRAAVWVVDAGSQDGSPELVRDAFPWATLVERRDNPGFGAAVNLVAGLAPEAAWIAPANADVALEPGALQRLLEAGARDPAAGAVAPRLVRPDGSTQHSVFPFPTLPFTVAFNLGRGRRNRAWADEHCLEGAWNPDRARKVPWAVAALLLVRREAWDAVGGFDPRQWLYAEDLDLGWRLDRAGWSTRYVPEARVRHAESSATRQAFGDERTERWMRATYAWMERRRGRPVTRAVAVVNVLGALGRRVLRAPPVEVHLRWARLHAAGLRPPAPEYAAPRMPQAEPTTACAACGRGPLRPHLRVRRHDANAPLDLVPTTDRFGEALADVVACAACGHGQLERFPTREELAAAYALAASEDYAEEEAGQRATARATLARIEARVAPGRLLDVGCWLGFLVAEAEARGWDAIGIEPSGWAAERARERLDVRVLDGDLDSAELEEGAWDAVVLADVLEHFVDPAAALARVRRLLAPGGVVYLALPDAGSRVARALDARWWSVLPTHVQYFTRGSLATLLRRTGFEPEWIGTAPKEFSVAYYASRLEGYSRPLGRAAVGATRLAGVAERSWAPDFRDRVAVVARAA